MTEPVPGEVSHWLRRASDNELLATKAEENAKHPLSIVWPLVIAIDEEIERRRPPEPTP